MKALVLVALLLAGSACAFAQDAIPQAKTADKAAAEAGNKAADKIIKPSNAAPLRLDASFHLGRREVRRLQGRASGLSRPRT